VKLLHAESKIGMGYLILGFLIRFYHKHYYLYCFLRRSFTICLNQDLQDVQMTRIGSWCIWRMFIIF